MSHLYFFLSIKCSESYVIVQNSKGTFHPTEFHLPVGISKAFQFDLTCLNICRVILKFHLTCDVKVDPCRVANLAVIIDSYRGWSHEISGNSQFFSLKREINSMTWVVGSNMKREINSLVVENIVYNKPISWDNTIRSLQSCRNPCRNTGGRKFRWVLINPTKQKELWAMRGVKQRPLITDGRNILNS